MKTKHTPGPWQVNRKYKMSVETCADGQGVNLIAECSDPDGLRTAGEDQANARLIAAAPELLAALEAVLFPIEANDVVSAKQIRELYADEIALAHAAIAKARGE